MLNQANESDEKQQMDDDILQGKKDVLRARDIIPSSRQLNTPDSLNQHSAEEETKQSSKSENIEKSLIDTEVDKSKTQIPQFDLAEEIMAQQRKITAERRKGPQQTDKDLKKEPKPEPKLYTIAISEIGSSEEKQLIAKIVAKDIQKLCSVG